MIWRRGEAAERFAERRRREEEAPRLATEIPALESLRLNVEERRAPGGSMSEAAHVRRIVVERAPAHCSCFLAMTRAARTVGTTSRTK